MENCGGRFAVWNGLRSGSVIVATGISVLWCISCHSIKKVSEKTMSRETVRLRQEVILLPETERLVIAEDMIRRLPVGESIRSRTDTNPKGGISLTKHAEGVIGIESYRDTVRLALEQQTEITQKEESIGKRKQLSAVYLLICMLFIVLCLTGLLIRKRG